MKKFVELSQLGKTYPTPSGPAEIVRDFTLDVAEGEIVCIVGHSGCGKSTVLSIVMGLIPATTGGVVIGGREVDGPGTDRGVVFQSATLLPWLSVLANVRLALDQVRPGSRAADALPYLEAVGLRGQGERYPRELSAGMQQRVGIARAFALEPRLLLLDEPAAGMNPTESDRLRELMRALVAEGITIILIEHDVRLVMGTCERVAVLNFGRKIAEGTPAEIRASTIVREAYLGAEAVA